MNIRPLMVGPQQKARAAEIVAYAQEHPYVMGREQPVPGDNPKFVGHFNSYRVVFTFTRKKDGQTFRHMTVSVPSKDYPNPFAVWMLADTFGFTGWDGISADVPKDWQAALNEQEHCVTVIQQVVQ